MKYRLLDLLKDPTDGTRLRVEPTSMKTVPFAHELHTVRCEQFCGLRSCSVVEARVTSEDCTRCYSQEILEGDLVSESGRRHPLTGGIPRLFSPATANWLQKNQSSFSLEWKNFKFGERNWGQDIDYRKQLFLKGVGKTAAALRGKLIFDAGCGSGALSIALGDDFGMEVVALDLAFGIEQAYAHNTNPFVHFVQGSVVEPPVRDHSVELLYCAGVLVHVQDAWAGFLALMPALKPGGRYMIWMYHPIDARHHPEDRLKMSVYNWIRMRITSPLPIRVQHALYLSVIPFYVAKRELSNLFGNSEKRTTWREKMQDLTDMFSPVFQHRFSEEEIIRWFESVKFENATLAYQEHYGFAAHGDKPRAAAEVS
jgi:ubiquinone/menaquinone biosynthesis C-methylase UbiE/uncharacterized protein YbaR (Trm112 family)